MLDGNSESSVSIKPEKENVAISEDNSVNLSLEITSSDESVTEEDLKSVLDGNSESSVSIKPEKENVAISEDNSVNLSLDLKEKDQNVDSTPVKMQYLSILGNLKSGSIVLEDESGVSHTYDFGNGTSTDNENTPNATPVKMQYLSILGNLKSGSIVLEDESGVSHTYDFGNGTSTDNENTPNGDAEIARNSTRSQNENLVIDLKGEIAVTKITINVTGVSDDDRNLAKIAKVEFLNDVYKEIPKPEMTVPEITGIATSTSTGNEHIELTWSKTLNITGYELKVEEIDEEGNVKGDAKTFRMSENSFKISNVKPYSRYRLSVQSINGEWLGGYGTNIAEKNVIENVDVNNNYKPLSDEVFKKNGEDGVVNVMVIPNEVPKYPEGIKAEGNYKSINLSWKTHNSARSFNVYYREKGIGDFVKANTNPITSNSYNITGNYKSINLSWKTHNSARSFNVYYREKGIGDFVKANTNPITSNSYNITGLKDDTTYEIKLDATNHLGTGEKSPTVLATTVDMSIPKTPKYKLINTDQEDGSIKTNNIEKVEYPESKTATVTKSNEYAVVDNNYYSYWEVNISDAGIGGTAENLGPKVSFDKTYTIDKVAVVSKLDGTGMTTDYAEIIVYNADDTVAKEYVPSFTNYTNNGVYTMLKLGTPITLSRGQKIQVNLRAKSGNVSITELKFYEYDDIEEKINELFDGELYVKLKDTVTNEQIAELEKRIEETDNGEYHPDKKELQKKIVRARRLFEDKELNDEITDLDIMINPGGTNTGYGNDWQALGLAAKAGETIKVYLSRDIDDNAINRDVYLGYEQNYAESGSAISQQIKLKPGENTIKINKLFDYDVEKGGNLYVRMSGMPDSKGTKIRIRVSGAEKIPHLNLNDKLVLFDYDVEKGGNLYVRMSGMPDSKGTKIRIRVSGAEKIPHLNLNDKLVDVDYLVEKKSENTDEKVKAVKDSLKKYILELKDHVENIEILHNASNEKHKNDDNFKNNIYKYDEKTSVLNSTNIEGDRFTLTIPATQVYKSLGLSGVSKNATDDTVEDATLNARVDKMYDSMLAWEQLIQITNAKKGVLEKDKVSKNATDDTVEDATLNARVDKMYDSMLAWEQLIQITNAKKGVLEKDNGSGLYANNKASRQRVNVKYQRMFGGAFMYASSHHVGVEFGSTADFMKGVGLYANNKASRQRVNVKYQRMFGGAFMYASSHHVGVEFGSTADFMKGVPYQFNDDGTVKNKGKGYLFGWGISHEIGHKADIAKRTYGETSNNILALITQTFDGVSESRLEMNEVYPKIYKKVTSNSVGASQDVATLLGMFWQLHLAYEPGYTSQMLKNNNDSDKNNDSYYAKMNRLYRNLTDTEQKLDKDQLLIRKASEAAGRDLRQFFASWGLISDENTDVYLQQKFSENERETRKIQYLNDEAYRRRLAGTADMESGTVVEASFDNVTAGNKVQGSSVTLNLNVNQSKDKILGYEIIRSDGNYNDNGVTKVKYRPVGFVNAKEDGSATFTDDVAPMNNRAFTYKVVAYDYNLKATEEVTLGTVKLSHDGTIKSNDFVIKSNMISTVGKTEGSNGESTVNENTTEDNSLDNIKDGDKATAFRGRRMLEKQKALMEKVQ